MGTPGKIVVTDGMAASTAYPYDSLSYQRNDVALAFAVKKIRGYGAFDEEWAGSGSCKASSTTLAAAEEFAKAFYLGDNDPELPTISLSNDGQVNFYWNTSSILLDLGIKGNGNISYYGRLADGAEFLEDDLPVSDPLPSEILTALKRV